MHAKCRPYAFHVKKGLSSCNPSTGLAKAVQNTSSLTKFLPEGMHCGDRPVELPDVNLKSVRLELSVSVV